MAQATPEEHTAKDFTKGENDDNFMTKDMKQSPAEFTTPTSILISDDYKKIMRIVGGLWKQYLNKSSQFDPEW